MALFATPFVVFLIPIVALICVFVFRAVEAIAKSSSEAAKHRSDNELKMVLAQRGMSASEIERIVAAKPGMNPDDYPIADESARASGALPPNKYQPLHSKA